MNSKICSRCKLEKKLIEFNFVNKSKGIYHCSCKSCDKIIRKKSYNKNKKTTYERNLKNSTKNQKWFEEYKANLLCSRCGENHIACLDFHHEDANKKEFNIANLARSTFSLSRIKKEIEKCIILCSNCHRKHHYNEFDPR